MEETVSGDIHGDIEVVKKMEDEHLRLQRQFRGIQTDRMHRTMGVHPKFRRQDALLRTLQKEYINLNKDIKIATSGSHKKNDKLMKKRLFKYLFDYEQNKNDVEGGLAIMSELDGLLQRDKQHFLKLRKWANASRGEMVTRRIQSENRLISVENKLEIAMLRFNAVQCENKQIREQIEHMLKDRMLFNQAWDKMLTTLGKGKKFLSDLFESSTLAYDQRDEWVNKVKSVQDKARTDQMMQVQEMRDLKKAYDHEMKIYNFLAKKGVMRVNKKQEERELEQKRRAEEEVKREFDRHVKILNEIHEYTQEPSYEKIIDSFVKREHLNFSIYKLLTEFCAENQVLKREVDNIRRDILDRKDQNEAMEIKRQMRLEALDKQLQELVERTEGLRRKRADQDHMLNVALKNIEEMFRMLDCSLEPFQNLLGDKQPTMNNLQMSLVLITEKIKDYVEIVFYSERALKTRDKTTTSRLKKYTIHAELPEIFTPRTIEELVSADPCPSCIESRWLSRVCESPEKPFTSADAMAALVSLVNDTAYVRSDRVHALADCRASASRRLLATRHAYI